jgi:hypothetical protein
MLSRYPIAFGFLLASALWAVYMVLQSDTSAYHQICEANQYGGKESCTPHHIPYVIAWYIGYWFDKASPVITALATAAVAWFTWTLWRSSEKMWSVTKEAADTAELNTRAAIAIQLPVLKVMPNALSWGSTGLIEHCSAHYVVVSNSGNTKAFPVMLEYGYAVGNLAEVPQYTFSTSYQPHTVAETGGKPLQTWLQEDCTLKQNDWAAIAQGNLAVWFYCNLVYLDFMQARREAAFCWCWEGVSWRADDTPAYNRKT